MILEISYPLPVLKGEVSTLRYWALSPITWLYLFMTIGLGVISVVLLYVATEKHIAPGD